MGVFDVALSEKFWKWYLFFDYVCFRTTTTGEQIALGFVWVKNEVMAFD